MPYSEKQRIVARIAEHAPQKLYKRNRGFLKMSKADLEEFQHGAIKKLHKKEK